MFTCGLLRSNFSLAMETALVIVGPNVFGSLQRKKAATLYPRSRKPGSYKKTVLPLSLGPCAVLRCRKFNDGAGEGNRTLVISLEGCCSTIELHPRETLRRRWWRRLDSNQRTLSERIYSPSPLTTRTLLQASPSCPCEQDGLELPAKLRSVRERLYAKPHG